jgi:hypothetical protein
MVRRPRRRRGRSLPATSGAVVMLNGKLVMAGSKMPEGLEAPAVARGLAHRALTGVGSGVGGRVVGVGWGRPRRLQPGGVGAVTDVSNRFALAADVTFLPMVAGAALFAVRETKGGAGVPVARRRLSPLAGGGRLFGRRSGRPNVPIARQVLADDRQPRPAIRWRQNLRIRPDHHLAGGDHHGTGRLGRRQRARIGLRIARRAHGDHHQDDTSDDEGNQQRYARTHGN